MRKCGVADKCVRMVQDVSWETVVRRDVGLTEEFRVEVRLH